jgi:hypothetical protein
MTPEEVYDATGHIWNQAYAPYIGALDDLRIALAASSYPVTHAQIAAIAGAVEGAKIAKGVMREQHATWAALIGRAIDTGDPAVLDAARSGLNLAGQWTDRLLADAAATEAAYTRWRAAAIAAQPDPGILDAIKELTRATAQLFAGLGAAAPTALPVGAVAVLGAVILGGLWWFRARPRARR